eukprot:706260_1
MGVIENLLTYHPSALNATLLNGSTYGASIKSAMRVCGHDTVRMTTTNDGIWTAISLTEEFVPLLTKLSSDIAPKQMRRHMVLIWMHDTMELVMHDYNQIRRYVAKSIGLHDNALNLNKSRSCERTMIDVSSVKGNVIHTGTSQCKLLHGTRNSSTDWDISSIKEPVET